MVKRSTIQKEDSLMSGNFVTHDSCIGYTMLKDKEQNPEENKLWHGGHEASRPVAIFKDSKGNQYAMTEADLTRKIDDAQRLHREFNPQIHGPDTNNIAFEAPTREQREETDYYRSILATLHDKLATGKLDSALQHPIDDPSQFVPSPSPAHAIERPEGASGQKQNNYLSAAPAPGR
jgi:hypothetical protein